VRMTTSEKMRRRETPTREARGRRAESSERNVAGVVQGPGQVHQLAAIETRINGGPHVHQLTALKEVLNLAPNPAVQREATAPPPNRTGLPDRLKTGLEQLSGFDLSGLRVHYNSSKPAQLDAHAYTRGPDIHVGPGQERHVPHEGWHAVQQMQDRVRPTMELRGTSINDDAGLEREADVMGARALRAGGGTTQRHARPGGLEAHRSLIVQRAVGFEFQTSWGIQPDPIGPVEGLATFLGQKSTGLLGETVSGLVGDLSGGLVRRGFNLGTSLFGGVGRLTGSVLTSLGAGSLVGRVGRRAHQLRALAPLVIIKGFTLVQGDGWTMSNDEGEMEFATEPFGETDVEGAQAVMESLTAFTGQLVGLSDTYDLIPIIWLEGSTKLGKVAAIVPRAPEMPAVPQMTAGIDLARLARMIAAIGTPGSEARQELTRERGATLQAITARLPERLNERSHQYRGMVALMATAVAQGATLPAVTTEKDITPLMARTNVGLAFARTPEREEAGDNREALTELRQMLLQDVVETASAAAGGATIFPIDADLRIFPDTTGRDMANRTGPTVRQWVNGVVEGRDLSSAGSILERLTARSMGAFQFMEDVGEENQPGIILEFRDLPRDLPRTEWTPWAVRMMEWVAFFNNMG
jgi:hypothetical protein